MSLSLSPSHPSPAAVGDIVTWSASTANADPGRLRYRFRVRTGNIEYQTIHDYSEHTSMDWVMSSHEGSYEVEASVNNLDTQESASTSEVYQITSQVSGTQPVLNPTANPPVALYSAPPCPTGSLMFVAFTSPERFVQTLHLNSVRRTPA